MSAYALGNRRMAGRAGLALVAANVRYWRTVAPIARDELRRWERRAEAIEAPVLRTVALEKLRCESFHAEAAAMLATLAPREHRRDVVEAIVALELLFDYLDGLTELPAADPLRDGGRLFTAYTDAVAVDSRVDREPAERRLRARDGGYLDALSHTVSVAIARLPAASAISGVAQRAAARGAEAQIRMHASPHLGVEQLELWASEEARDTDLEWRELLAGSASSVLALHALIVAAADPRTTPDEAAEIDGAYASTCVLLTLLDGLIDHEQDSARADALGYIHLYDTHAALARALSTSARRAAMRSRALRNGAHHAMILVGVVAYYASAPGARGALARAMVEPLRRQLAPVMLPTLIFLRTWRAIRRVRNWRPPQIRPLASPLAPSHTNGEFNET